MRYYVMASMTDPGRLFEGNATNAASSKQLPQKTDAEAVGDWEDEGGAFNRSDDRIVVSDLSQVRGNEVKKGAK